MAEIILFLMSSEGRKFGLITKQNRGCKYNYEATHSLYFYNQLPNMS